MPKMAGTTSRDHGHSHKYTTDAQGNGSTEPTGEGTEKHTHTVTSWVVQSANGHVHSIPGAATVTTSKALAAADVAGVLTGKSMHGRRRKRRKRRRIRMIYAKG